MDLEMDNIDEMRADIEFEDYMDNSVFEKERCGICMDIVMDRGVLDSCNHLFCFACIDNWATITNLCPLCKNEFQLITCLPVYDSFGNFKTDDHSLLSDDNWCIQERNSLLSFPSYYINEDAVKCLDDDGCKIRNGMSTSEEPLMFDTSIACDSCDIWYHAFCVGFDPETTSGSSWLCPRCLTNEAHHHSELRGAENGHRLDATFTGKVSISIADAGETAIVVSMFDKKQTTEVTDPDNSDAIREEAEEELRGSLGGIGFNSTFMPEDHYPSNVIKTRSVINSSDTQNCPELSDDLSIRKTSLPDVDLLRGPSTLTATNTDSIGSLLSKDELPTTDSTIHQNACVTATFLTHPGCQAFLSFAPNESLTLDNLKTKSTGQDIQGSCSHDDQKVLSVHEPAAYEALDGDNVATCAAENKASLVNVNTDSGIQGRSVQSSGSYISDETRKRQRNSLSEVDIGINEKKTRSSEGFQSTSLKCQETYDPCIAQDKSIPEFLVSSGKENTVCDITSIVQGTSYRSSNRSTSKSADDTNGFRVKKIMRVAENSDSSVLVQKLKNEIREAVRKNPSNDFGRDGAFDGKLLAAFRAAVAGPKNIGHKVDPSFIKIKKSLLQTGKARENLTKKIYGTSSGKRRRAWDREWEVEFWKHRCLSKTEKVETLQSVLDLLNKISSGNLDMNENSEEKFNSSILSRVYLADTSVFPRKDNIQPLSVLGESTLMNNFNQDNHAANDPREEAHCQRTHAVEVKQGGQISPPALKVKGNAKNLTKSSHGPLSDKNDKRKWALEVLARQRLSNGGEPSQGKHEDTTEIKGSYPLLAQLPVDMRPTVAPSCHGKVPLSARQAQLYRLTEFYLREANVSTIFRTAATELAVADAINVEKEIFERSNSKLVYINLCAQHTIHYRHGKTETMSSQYLGNTAEETKRLTDETTEVAREAHDSIEETLKMTGLLSDSPANSPDRSSGCYGTEDACWVNSENNHHEGMANTVPSSKTRTLTSQLRSEDGDLKMKEIFAPSKSENLGSEDHPCKATPGREQTTMGCDSLMVADTLADSPIVSAYRHQKTEITSSQHLGNTAEETKQITDETTVVARGACDATEEALKMTGLFSDSPTNSPDRSSGSYGTESFWVKSENSRHLNATGTFSDIGDATYGNLKDDVEGVVNNVSSSKIRTFPSQLRSEDVELKIKEIFVPSNSENLGSEDHPCKTAPGREPITMGFDSSMVTDSLADSSIVSTSKHEKVKEDSNSKCLTDCQGLASLSLEKERSEKYSMRECEQFHNPKSEHMVDDIPRKEADDTFADTISSKFKNGLSKDRVSEIKCLGESCGDYKHEFIEGKNSQTQSVRGKNIQQKENKENSTFDRSPHCRNSVSLKVEAYIKEHVRPLCKSNVITVEQYRWAVGKTTDKVMSYHSKDKNANFLIKEGDKVKRLVEQYVEAAQQKDWNRSEGKKADS